MTHHDETRRRLSACLVLLVLLLSLALSACTPQGAVMVPGGDVVIDTASRNDDQNDNQPDDNKPDDKGDTGPDHGASEDDSISGKDPTVLPDLPIGED